MIRKAIITALTVLALTVAVTATISFHRRIVIREKLTGPWELERKYEMRVITPIPYLCLSVGSLRVNYRRPCSYTTLPPTATNFWDSIPAEWRPLHGRLGSGGTYEHPATEMNAVVFQWWSKDYYIVGFDKTMGYGFRRLALPLWGPFIMFSIYPTVGFFRGPYRRWRRRRSGLCLKCGYNLTGNVSGVCPECGERRKGLQKAGSTIECGKQRGS